MELENMENTAVETYDEVETEEESGFKLDTKSAGVGVAATGLVMLGFNMVKKAIVNHNNKKAEAQTNESEKVSIKDKIAAKFGYTKVNTTEAPKE